MFNHEGKRRERQRKRDYDNWFKILLCCFPSVHFKDEVSLVFTCHVKTKLKPTTCVTVSGRMNAMTRTRCWLASRGRSGGGMRSLGSNVVCPHGISLHSDLRGSSCLANGREVIGPRADAGHSHLQGLRTFIGRLFGRQRRHCASQTEVWRSGRVRCTDTTV